MNQTRNEYLLSELGRKIVEALPDRAKVKAVIAAHRRAERRKKIDAAIISGRRKKGAR